MTPSPRLFLSRVLLLVGALTAAGLLRAQDSWLSAASPTSENLWSVAYGASRGLFVAIGDHGTLLTSPNGVTWTKRPVPTTNWLVGVTFENQFVAVGDAGTILTSPDGVTWTARTSGTAQRLNAVASGGSRWLAVGEKGTVLISNDAVTWTSYIRDRLQPPTASWLRGLTYAQGMFVFAGEKGFIINSPDALRGASRSSLPLPVDLDGLTYGHRRFVATGPDGLVLTSPDSLTWRASYAPARLHAVTFYQQFIGVGDNGAILTSPDATTWTAHAPDTESLLTAVAGGNDNLVAVGFGGVILHSSVTQGPPAILTPPVDVTEAAGNNVVLSTLATGPGSLSYQWSFNGTPIVGATRDELVLTSVTTAQSGAYAVTVSTTTPRNIRSSLTSAPATLTVVPQFPAPTTPFDPTFHPPVTSDAPDVVLALPNGQLILSTANFVTRLNADGIPDNTFVPRSFPSGLKVLVTQPDGKILVGGGTTTGYLSRLHADGQFDTAFVAPAAALGAAVTSLVVDPEGKIILANGTTKLVRLNSDGSLDSSFVSADLQALPNGQNFSPPGIKLVALAPGGKIVTAATPQGYAVFTSLVYDEVLVARFNPNGSLDSTFAPIRTGTLDPVMLSVRPDGKTLLVSEYAKGYFDSGSWKLQRLNADGTLDLTFLPYTGIIAKYGGNVRAVVDPAGRIAAAVGFQNAPPSLRLLRFFPDGTLDSTLRYETPGGYEGSAFNLFLRSFIALPDGRYLLTRDNKTFTRIVAANAPAINPPIPLYPEVSPREVGGGDSVTISLQVAGTGPFIYNWNPIFSDGSAPVPAVYPQRATETFRNLRNDGAMSTTVANAAGTLLYPSEGIQVRPSAPILTSGLGIVAAERGRTVTIPLETSGSGPLEYRWLRNGVVVSSGLSEAYFQDDRGDLNPRSGLLTIPVVDATTIGEHQLVLTNSLGSLTKTFTVAIDPTSRLVDISTRATVADNKALIAGFVIAGPGPKSVLIRGVGPGLAPFGVTGSLADPRLTLFDAAGAKLEENDNWSDDAGSFTPPTWPATFALTPGSRDAIISKTLSPGQYTAQLNSATSASGVALLEVYEDTHNPQHLINLSSRVFVGDAMQLAISGVVVTGERPKKLLIRAAGPALAKFGVSDFLERPVLKLVDAKGATLAINEHWDYVLTLAVLSFVIELRTASTAVGAFPFDPGSNDAAILISVPPGSYTAQVTSANGTTGQALIEIYEVP